MAVLLKEESQAFDRADNSQRLSSAVHDDPQGTSLAYSNQTCQLRSGAQPAMAAQRSRTAVFIPPLGVLTVEYCALSLVGP